MYMNYSQNSYPELKQAAQAVRNSIAAKQLERQALVEDIRQRQEQIDTLSKTMAYEESVMISTSKLKQPAMTAVEFIAKRKELEAMREELPTMNEATAFLDRSIESLQGELRSINDWMNRKLEMYSKELVPQLATRFVESSSADFKNLVTAVIAANGEQVSNGAAVYEAVLKALRDIEGYRLPDFGEARRFAADRLNAVAEAV